MVVMALKYELLTVLAFWGMNSMPYLSIARMRGF
jgi:hypothetical protein